MTDGLSRELVEAEILVPFEAQTCGQQPVHRWSLGRVGVESYDTPEFKTLYELRTVRVPKDATRLRFSESGREWVCWRSRREPNPKKKKRRGAIAGYWGVDNSDPAGVSTAISVSATLWHPIPQGEGLSATSLLQDSWEEGGRFAPLDGFGPMKVGIGFPLEFYGVEAGVGLVRPWISWDAADVAT